MIEVPGWMSAFIGYCIKSEDFILGEEQTTCFFSTASKFRFHLPWKNAVAVSFRQDVIQNDLKIFLLGSAKGEIFGTYGVWMYYLKIKVWSMLITIV